MYEIENDFSAFFRSFVAIAVLPSKLYRHGDFRVMNLAYPKFLSHLFRVSFSLSVWKPLHFFFSSHSFDSWKLRTCFATLSIVPESSFTYFSRQYEQYCWVKTLLSLSIFLPFFLYFLLSLPLCLPFSIPLYLTLSSLLSLTQFRKTRYLLWNFIVVLESLFHSFFQHNSLWFMYLKINF